jgi:hypothetical protein
MSVATRISRHLRITELTTLAILLLLIGAVTSVAFDSPAKKTISPSVKSYDSLTVEVKYKRLQAPTTSTTTTTTTVKRRTVASAPLAAPQGEWIAQCKIWMQGVIADDQQDIAIKLIERESHCNPSARNPNSSAGGIPQALPWTKMGCTLDAQGAQCQLIWMQGYVVARYGSWSNALKHSYNKGWY